MSSSNTGTGSSSRIILQCNVGNKSPLFLCVLSPEKVDSCQLNIEFQEAEDVIFSVIGSPSVHLTGYFLATGGLMLNDDHSYPLISLIKLNFVLFCIVSLDLN